MRCGPMPHRIPPGIHDKARESTFHGEGKKLRESWPFLRRIHWLHPDNVATPQALLGLLYTYWCMYIYIILYIIIMIIIIINNNNKTNKTNKIITIIINEYWNNECIYNNKQNNSNYYYNSFYNNYYYHYYYHYYNNNYIYICVCVLFFLRTDARCW